MGSRTKRSAMMYETAFLSIFSVLLQGLGLLLNIFLTRRLGAASVGMLTLMGSFYSLAAVLSGGSGFIASSRFLSEELGSGGNPQQVFRYVMGTCMTLSSTAVLLIWLFAPVLLQWVPQLHASVWTLRLLSLSLPAGAAMACLKGRCYAYHRVYLPAAAECIEFVLRAGVMAFCAVFFIPSGRLSILHAFALSMLAGQGAAVLFLLVVRLPHQDNTTVSRLRFPAFLRALLPIMGNAVLVALLSSANDALVPLTLLQYGSSTDEALAQFGEFEAIIIPTLFFPSVIQCCMSGLLVPELSHARSRQDSAGILALTERVLEQTMAFSMYVVLVLLQFGGRIGVLLGGDVFTGQILRCMAPVVPFIYLEIILEGVLRGLGKQNFSSVNYLAEYVVRISVLLICVPLFGFYGIVASYMACNLSGNAVRLYFVLKLTGLHPDWKRILLRPAFALALSWQLTTLLQYFVHFLHLPEPVMLAGFGVVSAGLYLFTLRVLEQMKLHPMRKAKGTASEAVIP